MTHEDRAIVRLGVLVLQVGRDCQAEDCKRWQHVVMVALGVAQREVWGMNDQQELAPRCARTRM